jgi:hypothetical protein
VNTICSPNYRLAQHLASPLSCCEGHSPHNVKKSTEFVHTLRSLRVDTHDIMVSLDVATLFTTLPIKETRGLLGRHFEEGIPGLFRHVLTKSYFTVNGSSTDKLVVWPWAHPISPVIKRLHGRLRERSASTGTASTGTAAGFPM